MISQLFNDSAVSHVASPAFIDAVYERLHLLEGLWSRYAFVDLPFAQIVRELNADMYYLFKGSLTNPPCTEDVTCVVFFLPRCTEDGMAARTLRRDRAMRFSMRSLQCILIGHMYPPPHRTHVSSSS